MGRDNSASLDLGAIKKRAEAATPGPWETGDGCNTAFGVHGRHPEIGHVWVADTFVDGDGHMSDVEFIAHARSDVPTLVAEVERLEAENRMMRDEGCPQCREALNETHEQIASFQGEVERLRAEVERLRLLYIEASNPGIDMEDVKRIRRGVPGLSQNTRTVTDARSPGTRTHDL